MVNVDEYNVSVSQEGRETKHEWLVNEWIYFINVLLMQEINLFY